MDNERNEVYERIPWETLERKGSDRQWVMFLIAGAIVVGALAYSFTSTRPLPMVSPVATVPVVDAEAPQAAASAPPAPISESAPADPVVVSEADLYAVDGERIIDQVVAHAEWFVAEYFTVDGSETSRDALAGLLPGDIPLPEVDTDTRVFVEWVRATEVEDLGSFHYRVSVLVRSLKADGDDIYVRQPPMMAFVELLADESGPRVLLPPTLAMAVAVNPSSANLVVVPDEVAVSALAQIGEGEVVGGTRLPDGSWQVVVVAAGPDGVPRPQTVVVR